MSSSPVLNKLSWNGLIIVFEVAVEVADGEYENEANRQFFENWADLDIPNWKIPASSPYPDIDEILRELYDPQMGEYPLAVFDRNRNLIWERSHGSWLETGLPVP